jgi:hypothetical protein
MAARALRAIHHAAPTGSISNRIRKIDVISKAFGHH